MSFAAGADRRFLAILVMSCPFSFRRQVSSCELVVELLRNPENQRLYRSFALNVARVGEVVSVGGWCRRNNPNVRRRFGQQEWRVKSRDSVSVKRDVTNYRLERFPALVVAHSAKLPVA